MSGNTENDSHPLKLRGQRRFLKTSLMRDLSSLEDICGDLNVFLKLIEHSVWIVAEGRLDIILRFRVLV